MSTAQRTVIAFLIPVALASVGFAVHAYLGYRKAAERERHYRIEREEVERGRYKGLVERTPDPVGPSPAEEDGDEYPRLLHRREISRMSPVEVSRLAGEMMALLRLTHGDPGEKYRAYVTLLNCREAAGGPLLESLRSEKTLEVYYGLRACADLKWLYGVDAGGDPSFLEVALQLRRDLPADAKVQLARLLGLYADERAASRLEELAADGDDYVKYYALLSLARVGRPEAVPVIARALGGDSRAVVAAACRALSAIVGFDVGDEFTPAPDYFGGLTREARKWRAWWEENRGKYAGPS